MTTPPGSELTQPAPPTTVTTPPQPVETPTPSPITQSETSASAHYIKLVSVSVVALMAATYFGYQVYQRETNAIAPNTKIAEDRKAKQRAREAEPKKMLIGSVIKHADNLLLITELMGKKKLTETESVVNYDYHRASGQVAYTHGTRQNTAGGRVDILPTQATLLNVTTGESKSIIEFSPEIKGDAAIFEDEIKDVSFSDDGKLIAISTSQSLSIHEVETGVTRQVFYNPYTGTNAAGILSYRRPVFSPDNTKVFLTAQEFERKGYMVVDLETGTQTMTDFYNTFGSNYNFLGWYNDDQILISFAGDQVIGEPKIPSLFLFEVASRSSKPVLASLPSGSVTEAVITSPTEAVVLIDSFLPNTQSMKHVISTLNMTDGTLTEHMFFFKMSGSPAEKIHSLEVEGDKVSFKVSSPSKIRPDTGLESYEEALYRGKLSTGTLNRASE